MSDDRVHVRLNGRETTLAAGTTLAAVVASLSPVSRRIAVECNGVIVPRSRWATCTVKTGDRLEIVGAVGGG